MDGKEGNKHVSLRKTTKTGKLDRELDKYTIYRGKETYQKLFSVLAKMEKTLSHKRKKKSLIARNKVNEKGTRPKRLKERNTLASLIGDLLSQKCLSFHN